MWCVACVVNNVQNDRLIILKFPFDLLRKTFLLAWVGIFFAFQQVFESNNSSIACCLSGASVPDKQNNNNNYNYSAGKANKNKFILLLQLHSTGDV